MRKKKWKIRDKQQSLLLSSLGDVAPLWGSVQNPWLLTGHHMHWSLGQQFTICRNIQVCLALFSKPMFPSGILWIVVTVLDIWVLEMLGSFSSLSTHTHINTHTLLPFPLPTFGGTSANVSEQMFKGLEFDRQILHEKSKTGSTERVLMESTSM